LSTACDRGVTGLFEYIRGVLIHKTPDSAVLEVGGLGFAINTTATTSEELPPVGEMCKVYTYLHVREDKLALFGFASSLERSVFMLLLDVGGIGPGRHKPFCPHLRRRLLSRQSMVGTLLPCCK